MFIRMFLYAKTKEEAINLSNSILLNLDIQIDRKKIVELEPYWKIDGIYEIGIEIILKNKSISKKILENFLKSLSNKWLSYGEPIYEILVTRNLDNTILTNKKIEMISISLKVSYLNKSN